MTRDDVSEGPLAKTDLKFGLVEKFDKRRNLDNGGTLWYTMQLFCHKGNPQSLSTSCLRPLTSHLLSHTSCQGLSHQTTQPALFRATKIAMAGQGRFVDLNCEQSKMFPPTLNCVMKYNKIQNYPFLWVEDQAGMSQVGKDALTFLGNGEDWASYKNSNGVKMSTVLPREQANLTREKVKEGVMFQFDVTGCSFRVSNSEFCRIFLFYDGVYLDLKLEATL